MSGEDPHTVIHVYEGDGGVIIRDGGNISTFGVQSRAVKAAFEAATDEPAFEHSVIADLAARLAEAERGRDELRARWKEADSEACAGRVITGRYKTLMAKAAGVLTDTVARAEAAEARLARMREALEPFAAAGRELAAESPSDMAVLFSPNGKHVRLIDIRRARAALEDDHD